MVLQGLWQRRLRQIHTTLAAVVGAQLLLWLVSGLFMVAAPIETVRGEHLRASVASPALKEYEAYIPPEIALASVDFPATEALLTNRLGTPVWYISGSGGDAIIDAISGEALTALSANDASEAAIAAYSGAGELLGVHYLDTAPQEYGGPVPVWRADFGPSDKASLYVDPMSGDLRSVRTPLWRAVDVFWGLHIMDWSTRENFNSWWLRATSVFALLFALSGAALLGTRAVQAWRRARRTRGHG